MGGRLAQRLSETSLVRGMKIDFVSRGTWHGISLYNFWKSFRSETFALGAVCFTGRTSLVEKGLGDSGEVREGKACKQRIARKKKKQKLLV